MAIRNNFGQTRFGVRAPKAVIDIVTGDIVLNLDPSSYSGSGTWYGVSPTTLNATLNMGTLHSNEINGIMYLDGYDDYISVSYSSLLNFTDGYKDLPFTITGWFKMGDSYGGPVISKSDNGNGTQCNYSISVSKTGINFTLYSNGGGGIYFGSTISIQENVWYQYSVTYTGGTNTSGYQTSFNGTVKIYLNGVLYPNTSGTWGVAYDRLRALTNPLYIGSFGTNGQFEGKFKGNLGQTIIYSKVLSATEILQNYNATTNIRYTISNMFSKYNGHAAIYSIRRINDSYTGPAMRVRKSSDDYEYNVYYDQSGNININDLSNQGDLYCSVWYDQSGNGRDLIQSIKSKQFRIASNGVVDTLGGKLALYRVSGTETISATFSSNLSTPNSIFSVMSISNTNGTIFENSSNFSTYYSNGSLRASAGTEISIPHSPNITSAKLYQFNIDGVNSRLSVNNSKGNASNAGSNSNMNGITIGGTQSNQIKLQELIIYDRPQDWNRTNISDSINSYYSLYTKTSASDLIFNFDPSNVNCYDGTENVIYDLSSENYNGVIYNGASYSSVEGGMYFDGINDHIVTYKNINLAESAKTLSVWIKLNNTNGGSLIRIGSGATGNLFELIVSSTSLAGHFWGSGYSFGVSSGKNMTGVYSHVVMTYKQKNKSNVGVTSIYVDGVLKGSFNTTLTNGSYPLYISNPAYSGTSWYNGWVYSAKLWKKDLTASEVLAEYNSTKSRFGIQ